MPIIKKTDMEILFPLIEENIKQGKDVRIKVTGYSMYPMVASLRDSVVLTMPKELRRGDIPLFKRNDGKYILHRIVGIKNGAYKIRGDYEQKIEYPVYPEQVIAVVNGFYRNNKYISCDNIKYKLYKAFWMNTAFFRPLFLKILAIRSAKIAKKAKKNVES